MVRREREDYLPQQLDLLLPDQLRNGVRIVEQPTLRLHQIHLVERHVEQRVASEGDLAHRAQDIAVKRGQGSRSVKHLVVTQTKPIQL